MKTLSITLVTLFTIVWSGCSEQLIDVTDDVTGVYEWESSPPGEQGFEESILENACRKAENFSYLTAFLIIRNGYIIKENYYYSYTSNDSQYVYSVTKSYLSALIGIAIENGFIESVEQKMLDFFPEYNTSDLETRKQNVTIKHLLTMQSGVDGSYYQFVVSDDWMRTAIRLSLLFDPGEGFEYTDFGPHLLSGIITKSTGMSALEFANRYLMAPMKIRIPRWNTDPDGYNKGGLGLYLYPRDMALFGYLYLNNGMFEGQELIPGEWIAESLDQYNHIGDWEHMKELGYGYLWYSGKMGRYRVYAAIGRGGNYIFIYPEIQMVVVTTVASVSNAVLEANDIMGFVYDDILSAIID